MCEWLYDEVSLICFEWTAPLFEYFFLLPIAVAVFVISVQIQWQLIFFFYSHKSVAQFDQIHTHDLKKRSWCVENGSWKYYEWTIFGLIWTKRVIHTCAYTRKVKVGFKSSTIWCKYLHIFFDLFLVFVTLSIRRLSIFFMLFCHYIGRWSF